MTKARILENLDLEACPRGEVSRLWIQLFNDGLGQPVRLPVLVARGRHDGPTVGLTAALHGNELNGIPVIHRLFQKIDCQLLHGTVVGVVVLNLPGFHRNQRNFFDARDLNHLFPGEAGADSARVYVQRLLDQVVRHLDVLIDLHTASQGRANCLYVRADMKNPKTARMAYLQRPQIIVHNPPHDGTLRGTAEDLGIPAITLEIGDPQRFQARYFKRALVGVRAVLNELGLVKRKPLSIPEPPVVCSSSYWIYTSAGGLLTVHPKVTQAVEAGEPIARLVDAFGDVVCEYKAPEDGVVIGHSVNPVAWTGARILHLGVEDTDNDLLDVEEAKKWRQE